MGSDARNFPAGMRASLVNKSITLIRRAKEKRRISDRPTPINFGWMELAFSFASAYKSLTKSALRMAKKGINGKKKRVG